MPINNTQNTSLAVTHANNHADLLNTLKFRALALKEQQAEAGVLRPLSGKKLMENKYTCQKIILKLNAEKKRFDKFYNNDVENFEPRYRLVHFRSNMPSTANDDEKLKDFFMFILTPLEKSALPVENINDGELHNEEDHNIVIEETLKLVIKAKYLTGAGRRELRKNKLYLTKSTQTPSYTHIMALLNLGYKNCVSQLNLALPQSIRLPEKDAPIVWKINQEEDIKYSVFTSNFFRFQPSIIERKNEQPITVNSLTEIPQIYKSNIELYHVYREVVQVKALLDNLPLFTQETLAEHLNSAQEIYNNESIEPAEYPIMPNSGAASSSLDPLLPPPPPPPYRPSAPLYGAASSSLGPPPHKPLAPLLKEENESLALSESKFVTPNLPRSTSLPRDLNQSTEAIRLNTHGIGIKTPDNLLMQEINELKELRLNIIGIEYAAILNTVDGENTGDKCKVELLSNQGVYTNRENILPTLQKICDDNDDTVFLNNQDRIVFFMESNVDFKITNKNTYNSDDEIDDDNEPESDAQNKELNIKTLSMRLAKLTKYARTAYIDFLKEQQNSKKEDNTPRAEFIYLINIIMADFCMQRELSNNKYMPCNETVFASYLDKAIQEEQKLYEELANDYLKRLNI
jgi:hypothetical protein